MDAATKKIAESSFRAGWYAAHHTLAEVARKNGAPDKVVQVLMTLAADPPPVDVSEGKGPPDGHTTLWMERQSLKGDGG